MISASTASHQFENEYFIQRVVWQRAEVATDLATDFHAQHHKDSEKYHVPIVTLHSPIWTASNIISLNSYQSNNANSKAFVSSATTANFAGRSSLRAVIDINVGRQRLMTRYVRDAEEFTVGTCPALSNHVASTDLTRC